jgi:predicted Zn-dependent protease
LNAVFLKFSWSDEYEADQVGVRMAKEAGYDPMAMAEFFELLRRQEEDDPSGLEQFYSSHPAPADRAARLRDEAARLGPVDRPREIGDFDAIRASLRRLPTASQRTVRPRDSADARQGERDR